MAIVNTLKIYEVLRPNFEEIQAKSIVDVIEEAFEQYRENQKEFLTTKEDTTNLKSELKEDISNLRAELKEDIANLRTEFKEDISNLRAELKEDKAEIIKWMFIFWVGQVISITGILFAFFKK